MSPAFVHLRIHTDYSLVDGIVRIKPLIEAVAQMGMPACAVTDQCNFYGLIKFYKAAQAKGLKPICGSDFLLMSGDREAPPTRFTLLAMNDRGYRNITNLISRAYLQGQHLGVPTVERTSAGDARFRHGHDALVGEHGVLHRQFVDRWP